MTIRVRILISMIVTAFIVAVAVLVSKILLAGYFFAKGTESVRSFASAGILATTVILGISIFFILLVTKYISLPIVKIIDTYKYDALTGIYNRRYFDEKLPRLMKTLSRSNSLLSMMMVDIDFFKNYNDTYGHSEGDRCLKAVAKALTEGITRTDDFVARYGGEEFVIVLPNTDENGACFVAKKLLENVINLNIPHENSAAASCVTVSIGVTTGRVDHAQTGEEYINRADAMLYESKSEGRNRYDFASLETE